MPQNIIYNSKLYNHIMVAHKLKFLTNCFYMYSCTHNNVITYYIMYHSSFLSNFINTSRISQIIYRPSALYLALILIL